MRFLFLAVLVALALGCGDDDDDDSAIDDASTDAGPHHTGDAAVPHKDGSVADGGALKDAGSAHDAGDAAQCDLEPSYVWAFLACTNEGSGGAKRVTLTELCEDYACPPDWSAALAEAAACDETDAGWRDCWSVGTQCGTHLLRANAGPDPRFLYYDDTTGKLIGGAIQLTDAVGPGCVTSEIIWGENPPACCADEDVDAG